ncbi:hypothetical protein C8J56DRAFT_903442 [Mycena floridula]|nr:hypothetical protein C8J56DRAFT_903442 [Mycena floridula]
MMNPEAEMRRLRRLQEHISVTPQRASFSLMPATFSSSPPAPFSSSPTTFFSPLGSSRREISLCPISPVPAHLVPPCRAYLSPSARADSSPVPAPSPSCAAASSPSDQAASSTPALAHSQAKFNIVKDSRDQKDGKAEERQQCDEKEEERKPDDGKRVHDDDDDGIRPSKRRRATLDCQPNQPLDCHPIRAVGIERGNSSDFSSNRDSNANDQCSSFTGPSSWNSTASNANPASSSPNPHSSTRPNLPSSTLDVPVQYMRYQFPVQSFSPAMSSIAAGPVAMSINQSIVSPMDQDMMELGSDDELVYPPSPENGSVELANEKTNAEIQEKTKEKTHETLKETVRHSSMSHVAPLYTLPFPRPSMSHFAQPRDEEEQSARRQTGQLESSGASDEGDEDEDDGVEDKDDDEEDKLEDEPCYNSQDEACYDRIAVGTYSCTVPHCSGGPYRNRSHARRHARNTHGLGAPPDVRCPIPPCNARYENRAACKRHCNNAHPGKWDDMMVLKHRCQSWSFEDPVPSSYFQFSSQRMALIEEQARTNKRTGRETEEDEDEDFENDDSDFEDDDDGDLEDEPTLKREDEAAALDDESDLEEADEEKSCYRRTKFGDFYCTVPRCRSEPARDPYNARRHARNVHGLGEAPDIRCPIRPCKSKLLNREACKRHVQEWHAGKWNDSLVLEHLVPFDPYVRPKKGHSAPLKQDKSQPKGPHAASSSQKGHRSPSPKGHHTSSSSQNKDGSHKGLETAYTKVIDRDDEVAAYTKACSTDSKVQWITCSTDAHITSSKASAVVIASSEASTDDGWRYCIGFCFRSSAEIVEKGLFCVCFRSVSFWEAGSFFIDDTDIFVFIEDSNFIIFIFDFQKVFCLDTPGTRLDIAHETSLINTDRTNPPWNLSHMSCSVRGCCIEEETRGEETWEWWRRFPVHCLWLSEDVFQSVGSYQAYKVESLIRVVAMLSYQTGVHLFDEQLWIRQSCG